jgi:4-diphosphocytidyl-2-C-methyl-D-erythritol kinase
MRSPAPAKINLCLFVGGVRDSDSKHRVVSVMQAIDLVDDVELSDAEADRVVCDGVEGPNLAEAALTAFREASGDVRPAAITIRKRIPVAAGMAGGSADAGAVLRLLNRRAGDVLDDGRLHSIAAVLGADVPAQLLPGRALALGAGEHVEQLPLHDDFGVVVLPHDEPLATPAVFAKFDRLGLARSDEDLEERLEDVRRAVVHFPDHLIANDLEPAAISLCPAIEGNLRRLRGAGADVAFVSGSGPTTLGLCRDPARADEIAAELGAISAQPWRRGAVIE